MSKDAPHPMNADELAAATRELRKELEAALVEAQRQDPRRASPLPPEPPQTPRDWRDAEILRLATELLAASRSLATLEEKARTRDDELARLRQELATAKANAALVQASETEAARLRAELQALLGSTSWRISAPLRHALDRLRGRRPSA